MGLDLIRSNPVAEEIFRKADTALGYPLSEICFNGPEERLNHDLISQLAVYTVSCILTEILSENGVVPDVVTGYSSGFYAAAYAAGCFDFEIGLNVVELAGQILLEEAERIDGRLAVIFGLSREKVEDICKEAGEVDIAIFNTPSQIIISGKKKAVEKAMAIAMEKNALDAYLLPGAVAYHSRFAESSSERLLDEMEDEGLRDPSVPLISYLTLEPVETKEAFKRIIAEQLSKPVRWVELIRKLGREEGFLFVEPGPGSVISRTVRWIDRSLDVYNAGDMEQVGEAVEGLLSFERDESTDISDNSMSSNSNL
jgi:[acyl-carrier-protein] S-malonyltransferase